MSKIDEAQPSHFQSEGSQKTPERSAYIARLQVASRSLFWSVGGVFEAGTELVGIIELRNGKQGQFHLTLVSDENEFLDSDAPTGCADDLIITPADFAVNGQGGEKESNKYERSG